MKEAKGFKDLCAGTPNQDPSLNYVVATTTETWERTTAAGPASPAPMAIEPCIHCDT